MQTHKSYIQRQNSVYENGMQRAEQDICVGRGQDRDYVPCDFRA